MTDRPYHHGGLRSALLAEAEGTLRTAGVDGLSLRELARELGVSHGAPQRHFRDKAALLDALALEGFARLDKVVEQAGALDDRTFHAMLIDVAVGYVRFATGNPALLDLMFTHKHTADASHELKQAANASLTRMIALVEHGQSNRDLVDGDPESIAMVLFATLQGITSLDNSHLVDQPALDELTAYAVNSLLNGLSPRPTKTAS